MLYMAGCQDYRGLSEVQGGWGEPGECDKTASGLFLYPPPHLGVEGEACTYEVRII